MRNHSTGKAEITVKINGLAILSYFGLCKVLNPNSEVVWPSKKRLLGAMESVDYDNIFDASESAFYSRSLYSYDAAISSSLPRSTPPPASLNRHTVIHEQEFYLTASLNRDRKFTEFVSNIRTPKAFKTRG